MTLDDYVLTATKARASSAPPSLRNPLVAAAREAALSTIAHQAFKDGVGLDYFYGMVLESQKFFDEFFSATKPAFPESDDRRLWAHQKFGPFENIDPKTDIDIKKVKEIADAYFTKPVIHDPYFGWCLLDSLIFTEIKSFLRVMMATQFGSAPGNPAYFLSKGNEARYDFLSPLFFVLAIVFNYVTPVAIGYYAVENGHEIIGGLFYAIAAVGVLSYVATYSKRQATKKSNEEKLKKVLELYEQLKNEMIPANNVQRLADEASKLGVRFDNTIRSLIQIALHQQ
ncbi:hypothetical protein [Methylocystis hirsuta]|jgi:hypothetical protein|uniref:Uncharacterized protein n=1 Tax=Methylocystis hirsuta TaxID=369798 RepID=A0A3M9XIP6_9HYPH|nr:hypothetical protein [Methylocystis hirsuta]RNJ47969.1 hypothetical protein D1O30_21285 [Methylocystis hirsuta]